MTLASGPHSKRESVLEVFIGEPHSNINDLSCLSLPLCFFYGVYSWIYTGYLRMI